MHLVLPKDEISPAPQRLRSENCIWMRKLSIIVVAFVVASCWTQPDINDLVNDMVVLTNYDTNADFNTFTTYTMPLDTIGLVSNSSTQQYIVSTYSKRITSTVKRSMDGTNRTRVATGQPAHLGINIYVVNDLQVFQSVVYPGYGYPGYGGFYGYSGYYNYPQVVNYQTQSAILVIEFLDLLNMDPSTSQPKIIWSANIGDLINSLDQDAKVVEAIQQAFTQSSYLNR